VGRAGGRARGALLAGPADAGRPTIAVRAPRHAVARRLLAAFGGPISAPSANRSGHVSPTTAQHVADDFGAAGETLLILDGGDCEIGLESTVLDLTAPSATILRPGSVTALELRDVIGDVASPAVAGQAASPGTAPRHYAPRTPAEVVETRELAEHLARLAAPAAVLCFDAAAVPSRHRAIVMPQGAGDYAHRLYRALREADALGMERIVIEEPPASNEIWKAINDRLARGTAAL
jgi:L-threonylcarbamoyladenylate synthase